MARKPRLVAAGVPHHVTQRGNNRQPIFLDNFDRHCYCKLLGHWSRCRGLGVLGYCWMSNYVPLVVVPEWGDALARGFVSPFQGLGDFGDGLPTAERRGLLDSAAPERGSEGNIRGGRRGGKSGKVGTASTLSEA
jgi:hypothetical protein